MGDQSNAPVLNQNRSPLSTAQGCFARLNGIFMIAGSLGLAAIGWFALSNIAANLEEMELKLPAFARAFVQHRAWLAAWVVPPLIMGFVLVTSKLPAALRWTLIVLGDLWLFALVAMILYCFILSVAPLYKYQPLVLANQQHVPQIIERGLECVEKPCCLF